jgi:hypothetical protein
VDFFAALSRLGFRPAQDRPSRGVESFVSQPNRFLTYWVKVYDDGTALFTWEFAITDYLQERGFQLGSSEALNLFLFPAEDLRGSQDPAWLTSAVDRTEAHLREIDFLDPDRTRSGS